MRCYNFCVAMHTIRRVIYSTIGDFGIPSKEGMKKTLDTIDNAVASIQKVYVHCHGGIGRKGTAGGCFLARH